MSNERKKFIVSICMYLYIAIFIWVLFSWLNEILNIEGISLNSDTPLIGITIMNANGEFFTKAIIYY